MAVTRDQLDCRMQDSGGEHSDPFTNQKSCRAYAADWFGPQRCRERSMFKGRAARFEVWPGYGKAGFQIRITWRSGRASFLGCFASFEEARGWIDREAKTWLW
jgi:hypothetical protein